MEQWEKSQLYKLVEIVQQSSDPDFAQLINNIQKGQSNLIQIKALANTDTATWSNLMTYIKVYSNYLMAGLQKCNPVHKPDSEVNIFKA